MEISSYMGSDRIPASMFYGKLNSKYSRNEINSAVSLLKKYSMISGGVGVINVHRLVQRVIQLKIKSEKREMDVLGMMFENIDFPRKNWSARSHFMPVWSYADKYDQLIMQFGHIPNQILDGRFHLKQIRQILPRMSQLLGHDHEHTLSLRLKEARGIFRFANRRYEGLKMFEQIYLDSCKRYGALNPVTTKIADKIMDR